MIKKTLFLLAAVLFGTAAVCTGQQIPVLPNDPATKVGRLDNGLTYYIRHNDKPAARAEFYLATNVGAIQEEPDQDGLAHFLEHMCFNGTKNFPEKGILNWLESIGASFGGNVNASTGVEQTIYLLNNIPLIRPTVVDTCLLIMHDYSHFVTCDPVEIDKERGVILEEKRSRDNAAWRMSVASNKYLFGDTKYAGCTIIGSEENLKTFKPESLTNFYHTWYHPGMQALIVVGDIDVDEVEAKIRDIFADIPAAENPKAKDVITIPDNVEPIVGIITDPEANSIKFDVYWKSEARPEEYNNTTVGLMSDLVQEIISTIMNERFNDITARPDAPFLGASLAIGNYIETMDVVYSTVSCKEGEALEGLEAMLTEVEKMHRFGFSDSEIERAKTEILSQYETAANKADTRKNAEFIRPMINNFFDNYAFMDPATEYEYVQAIMQQLPAQLINQLAQQVITKENIVALYKAPEREGLQHPSEEEVLEVIGKIENSEIEMSEGEEIPSEFLNAAALKGSKVKKISEGLYGSTELILKNGLKVILLPTDHEKDRISFTIFNKGGKSLIDDEDLYSFDPNIWALYLQNTGISGFPATTVNKMLAGKQLSVTPFLQDYIHGISGSSTRKDLETALQLAYLYYADPRFNEDEYNQGIKTIESVLPNIVNQPNFKFQKELYENAYDSPRMTLISDEVIAKASLATIEKNYRRLFKDIAGATMIMVGDFEVENVIPLIEKYAGSLAKGKKGTDWSYRNDGIIDGRKIHDFTVSMQVPKVTVGQIYKVNAPYSVQADVNYSALSYILDMIYTETLREDEGGTYGASAVNVLGKKPFEARLMQVVFETNEESADKLRELAVKGLQGVAENGPTAEQFDKTIKNLEKNIPENKMRNSYWLSAIRDHELYGFDYISEYEAAVNSLTSDMIKDTAKELLESGNYLEFVMRPEK